MYNNITDSLLGAGAVVLDIRDGYNLKREQVGARYNLVILYGKHGLNSKLIVDRFCDGDTIICVKETGEQIILRLWGMDAPEHGQMGFRASKMFLTEMVARPGVAAREMDCDKYGRCVVRLRLPDGRDVTEEMISAGWAWWYRRYVPRALHLAKLERAAQVARLGIWAEESPVTPWAWRKGVRKHGAAMARKRNSRETMAAKCVRLRAAGLLSLNPSDVPFDVSQ